MRVAILLRLFACITPLVVGSGCLRVLTGGSYKVVPASVKVGSDGIKDDVPVFIQSVKNGSETRLVLFYFHTFTMSQICITRRFIILTKIICRHKRQKSFKMKVI